MNPFIFRAPLQRDVSVPPYVSSSTATPNMAEPTKALKIASTDLKQMLEDRPGHEPGLSVPAALRAITTTMAPELWNYRMRKH